MNKLYTITIAMIKMFVMNYKMFILNWITKKADANAAVAEFMNGMEAMEDEFNNIGIMNILMLILFVLITAIASGLLIDMAAIAAAIAGGVIMIVAAAIAGITAINNKPEYGRSCAHFALGFI